MRNVRTSRRITRLAVAVVAVGALAGACSSDDDGGTSTGSGSGSGTTSGTAASGSGTSDDTMAGGSDDTMADEGASGEVGTTELLEFLNEEDPAIGALFDWNTGEGVIAITYLGTQNVGLYAVEVDVATATEACELASTYVYDLDESAVIEVFTGGYDSSTLVVSRTGSDGSCTPA